MCAMRKTIIPFILIGIFSLGVLLGLVHSRSQITLAEALCGMLITVVFAVGEGFLISAVFKTQRIRTILLMTAAFFFSTYPGLVEQPLLVEIFERSNFLYHLKLAAIMSLVCSYATMVLVGWPFCAMAMKRRRGRLRKAFLASLLAQTVLYAIMAPLYCWAMGFFLKQIDIDRNLVAQTRSDAMIYYMSESTNSLCKIRVNGTGEEVVMHLLKEDCGGTLFAQRNTESAWDLWLSGAGRNKERKLLLKSFARHPVSFWATGNESLENRQGPEQPDFRPEKDSNWHVWNYPETFSAGNQRTSETLDLIFPETPFGQWKVCSLVALPGDRVVFQLGPQIVLVDLNQWKMGLVATGRGLVVVWEGEPENSPAEVRRSRDDPPI